MAVFHLDEMETGKDVYGALGEAANDDNDDHDDDNDDDNGDDNNDGNDDSDDDHDDKDGHRVLGEAGVSQLKASEAGQVLQAVMVL